MDVEQWIIQFLGNDVATKILPYLTLIVVAAQSIFTFVLKNRMLIKAALIAAKDQQINNLERKINALCEVCLVLAEQNSILVMHSKLDPEAKQKVAERAERMRVLAKSVNLDMAKDVVESVKSFDVKKEKEKYQKIVEQVVTKQEAVIQTNSALEEAAKRMNVL